MINLADVAQALRLHRALAQQPSYRGDVRLMPQPAPTAPNGAAASAQMMSLVSGTPTAPAFDSKPVTSHDMVAGTAPGYAAASRGFQGSIPLPSSSGVQAASASSTPSVAASTGGLVNQMAGQSYNPNFQGYYSQPTPTGGNQPTFDFFGNLNSAYPGANPGNQAIAPSEINPFPSSGNGSDFGTSGSGNTMNLIPSGIAPNPFAGDAGFSWTQGPTGNGGGRVGDIPAYGVVGGSTNAAGNTEPIYQGGQPGTIDHILYGHGGSVGDQVGNALLKAAPFVTPYGVIARPLLKLINGDFGHLGGLGDIGHYLEHNARTYDPSQPNSPSNMPPAANRTSPYVDHGNYAYPGATAIPLNSSMAQYMNGIGPGGRQVASGGLTGISGGAGGVNNDEIMQAMLMRGTNE